jgi:crossover junction endodeoxyribonuclease RuvC
MMIMSEVCILGVDPGLSGAIAFLFPMALNRVVAEDMPVVNGQVDVVTLADRVRQMAPSFAIIEAVHSMPGQGVASTFKFGMAYGSVIGVLGGLSVPMPRHYVTPNVWKKHFKLPPDKEAARALALQRFPATGFHFARKKDHGRAEAALIALYAHEMDICA